MKKTRIIAVMAALIVSLSGCANMDRLQTIQDSSGIEVMPSEVDEITEPEESSHASVSESIESSADSTVEVEAETESAQGENSMPTATQSPAVQTQSPQTAVPNDTPKPEQPKTVELEPTPQAVTPKSVMPSADEQPTPKPAQTEPPQQITPPPEESTVPEFDIDYWISFAKSYAVSIGLELSPTAVECWDNPMIAGTHSKYLERDITDCLNCYKNIEDFTGVWVWTEPDGNGAYKLYIGYE